MRKIVNLTSLHYYHNKHKKIISVGIGDKEMRGWKQTNVIQC